MADLQKDFAEFKIFKKGEIELRGGLEHPIFNIYEQSDLSEGLVYLWVEERNNIPISILYVGKAGKTLFKRCGEHLSGFKGGSKTGIRNANSLLSLLNTSTKVGIYARVSDKVKILGEEQISLCDAEEKALIKKYKPSFTLFNKT